MLSAITWNVDPAIFEIFGREIRWYGLLFAMGLLILGPAIEERIWKNEKLDPEWMNSLYIYVVLGTVIGARLGHVLFYNPQYYFANPSKILAIWEGGLASHGGTIGVIFACWLFSHNVIDKKPLLKPLIYLVVSLVVVGFAYLLFTREIAENPLLWTPYRLAILTAVAITIVGFVFFKKASKSFLWTLDRLAVPTGLAAAFIRLGNLMNSEIFGRPTDLPWGFRFLRSREYHYLVPDLSVGCHPTQIYEALAYLLVFAGCMWLYWKRDAARRYSGLIVGFFLTGIFASRLLIESIKNVQEVWEIDMQASIGLNQGQLLSIPFILVGIYLMVQAYRKPLEQAKS